MHSGIGSLDSVLQIWASWLCSAKMARSLHFSATTIALNATYRLCVTADTTGGANLLSVSINGIIDVGLSINGLDIVDSAAASTFAAVRMLGGGVNCTFQFDDLFVGLDECVQLGPKEILTSPADGTILGEFTRSAGASNHLNIDDIPSNLDVDYNHSNTLNQRDIFSFTNLTRVPESIVAIGMLTQARKESSATRKIRNIIKTGGVEYVGEEAALSESYLWVEDHWLTNPNTAVAWTGADRDAAEGGYKLSAIA